MLKIKYVISNIWEEENWMKGIRGKATNMIITAKKKKKKKKRHPD